MAEERFRIGPAESGERADKILVAHLPGLGRKGARRLFDEGKIRINGRRVSKGDVAREGDEVTVTVPDLTGPEARPEPAGTLRVHLETDQVVVVDKPAGQPTAPIRPGETGTLANALVGHYPEMSALGHGPREPGLVHRLDTDTSGLVVAARTPAAFETLTRGLKEGRLDKAYLVVCEAEGLGETGTIEIPLSHHPKDKKRMYACAHPRDLERYAPRPARTSFRLVHTRGRWALVELRAKAALRHQIRVHMAAIGHPLVGDLLYGGPTVAGLGRHALHASYVGWPGDAVVPAFQVRSPLPDDLASLVGEP
jgi:23S rRNA pseudouridine1911/1915/1917 synthase